VRRIQHLLQHRQPPTTPICTYIQHNNQNLITAGHIRDTLRRALRALGPTTLGIQPSEINARSLRAGGATALLCATIDQNTIQVLGRWKSDAMSRYLHVAVTPPPHQYAKAMMTRGQASFAQVTKPCNILANEQFSPPLEEFLHLRGNRLQFLHRTGQQQPLLSFPSLYFFPHWTFGMKWVRTRDLGNV
jgi:hypothetical protein